MKNLLGILLFSSISYSQNAQFLNKENLRICDSVLTVFFNDSILNKKMIGKGKIYMYNDSVLLKNEEHFNIKRIEKNTSKRIRRRSHFVVFAGHEINSKKTQLSISYSIGFIKKNNQYSNGQILKFIIFIEDEVLKIGYYPYGYEYQIIYESISSKL